MLEAAAAQSSGRLRNLFAILMTTCRPFNPGQLLESYKESLAEDILMQARKQNTGMNLVYTSDMFNQALIFLEDKVLEISGRDLKQLDLPSPQRHLGDRLGREILS
jgi:hypothetical protein